MNNIWINQIIVGLLDTYNSNDPYELCKLLNILVIKLEPDNPLLSGEPAVYMNDSICETKEFIYIRNDLPKSYEEFYLKHELGHAVLHSDLINNSNDDIINMDKLEKQANYFAFELSDIKLDPTQFENYTIKQIASFLELPEEEALFQYLSNIVNAI